MKKKQARPFLLKVTPGQRTFFGTKRKKFEAGVPTANLVSPTARVYFRYVHHKIQHWFRLSNLL